ncbi:YPL264C-like protein [Saccharomyces cerevisiae x Saccharomyces kudriavzevii VIN7]|uniref:YPL264C-like protein n=1 Tax=Saccharomyces cerevisiae x Saccharomyces kudriavzevii (strain VIN7) TaxID=1095631 RepID=H0H1Q5_SACCK|nr:YPL264C-like protein [Saccharomyces cerevisiae x Saccharomyces kudriavzevii VIN7]
MYFSLMYLSISDAVLITFMSPTLTIFLSFLLLGEPFSKSEALGSLISFSGVVLIIRPTFLFGQQSQDQESSQNDSVETKNPKLRLIAIGVSLLGVCGLSSVYIIIRHIGNKAHGYHECQLLLVSHYCRGCSWCDANSRTYSAAAPLMETVGAIPEFRDIRFHSSNIINDGNSKRACGQGLINDVYSSYICCFLGCRTISSLAKYVDVVWYGGDR